MKSKLFLLITGILSLFIITTSASAFNLVPGPFKFKYSNWEDFNLPGGPGYFAQDGDGTQDNYGIFDVTSFLTSPDGGITFNQFWTTPNAGVIAEELTGEFYGIDVQSISAAGSGLNIQSVGGQLDLYLDGDNDLSPLAPATATDGVLQVSFLFVPGIDPLTDATLDGNTDGSTAPLTGDVAAYLSVIPGSGPWAESFDTNGFATTWTDNGGVVQIGTADMFIQSDFRPWPGATFDLQSEDPAIGFLAPIPEPSTYLLFGLGMIGLARFIRRSKPAIKN